MGKDKEKVKGESQINILNNSFRNRWFMQVGVIPTSTISLYIPFHSSFDLNSNSFLTNIHTSLTIKSYGLQNRKCRNSQVLFLTSMHNHTHHICKGVHNSYNSYLTLTWICVSDIHIFCYYRNKCAACFRQFNKLEHLVEHMRISYHSVHEPTCGICRKHCRSFESLREHLIGNNLS